MNPLRMTRRLAVASRRPARVALIVGLAFGLMALVGCGKQAGAEDAAAVEQETVINPAAAELPPPATDRIDYDSRTRTLTFYDLPESARWMVRKPHSLLADSVGPDHRLPEGIDPEHTFVFYRRPGGQQSRAVSLAQIQAARQMHDSLRN